MNIVKLVAIASATHFGVEVQAIDNSVQKVVLVEQIKEQPQPLDIRVKLIAAIEKLGADYTVVAPTRYKLPGTVTAEKAGLTRDALHGYESFAVREEWSPEVKVRQKTTLTVEAALAAKTKTTGAIAVRNGNPTKASIVREIIKTGLSTGNTTEMIVSEIVKACGFAVQLARVYFKENLKKVYAAPQQETAPVIDAAPDAVDAAIALLEAVDSNTETVHATGTELVAA